MLPSVIQTDVVVVLANLAVRVDRRKRGVAKKLMLAAEEFVKVGLLRVGWCIYIR